MLTLACAKPLRCTIVAALGRRYWNSLGKEQATIAIYDRGIIIFEAVTTTVIAVKSDSHDLSNARNKFEKTIERNGLRVARAAAHDSPEAWRQRR